MRIGMLDLWSRRAGVPPFPLATFGASVASDLLLAFINADITISRRCESTTQWKLFDDGFPSHTVFSNGSQERDIFFYCP